MLENISNIIGGFCLVSVGLMFGYILSDTKLTKNKKIITIAIIIIYSILYGLIYKEFDNSLRSIINFVINTLIFKFLFDFKFTKAIFISFLHVILLIISELTLFAIVGIFTGGDKSYIHENLAGNISGNIIVSAIFVILTLILRKTLRKLINFKVSSNKKLRIYMDFII